MKGAIDMAYPQQNLTETEYQEQRRRERRIYLAPEERDELERYNRIMDSLGYGIAFLVAITGMMVLYVMLARWLGWW